MQNTADNNTAVPKKRGKFKTFLLIFFLSFIAASFIYYFVCGMTYSKGTRSGILTKVSEKGYVFKTFEGEMYVGSFNQEGGAIVPATIFKFSVPDKKVYDQLEVAQGKKVVLHYKQVMKNFFWQGETDYFIYKVDVVQ